MNDDEKDDQEQEPVLRVPDELRKVISGSFTPCEKFEDATIKLSTQDIYTRLQTLYLSDEYNEQCIYSMMIELGFKFQNIAGKFMWLMKSTPRANS